MSLACRTTGHENVEKYKQFMREYKKLADKREKSATAMVDRWADVIAVRVGVN